MIGFVGCLVGNLVFHSDFICLMFSSAGSESLHVCLVLVRHGCYHRVLLVGHGWLILPSGQLTGRLTCRAGGWPDGTTPLSLSRLSS